MIRQKSYVNRLHKPIEFQVWDKVVHRVSPNRKVMRVWKKGKLSPKFRWTLQDSLTYLFSSLSLLKMMKFNNVCDIIRELAQINYIKNATKESKPLKCTYPARYATNQTRSSETHKHLEPRTRMCWRRRQMRKHSLNRR